MNRGEIRTRILNALNESASAPVFWTTAQMSQAIADGMDLLAEEAQQVKRTAICALQPGSQYYSTRGIALDLMIPTRIWVPSLNRRLTVTTVGQLDAYHERWQTVTGDPQYWFPMGWDWFGIFPHPSTGGGTMRVDYLAWPRPLLDDGDEPELYGADHDGLVLYGIYEGLLKRWDAQGALIRFVEFLEHYGLARARGGSRQLQARTWQKSSAVGNGLQNGNLGSRY